MIFIYHSGEEWGWKCAYRNLKDEDQEETGAHVGVVGEQAKAALCKSNSLGLKVLGSTMCDDTYIHTHTYVYTHMYTHTYIHICIYTHMYICAHIKFR